MSSIGDASIRAKLLTTSRLMKDLPKTENALVLRTDFSDEAAWTSICKAILEPDREFNDFHAYVTFISDPDHQGLTPQELMAHPPYKDLEPHDFSSQILEKVGSFIFMVDGVALTHPERPILAIDLWEEPGRTFRVIPSQMWSVQNNLSISNMDFSEFADKAEADGIFRGFA